MSVRNSPSTKRVKPGRSRSRTGTGSPDRTSIRISCSGQLTFWAWARSRHSCQVATPSRPSSPWTASRAPSRSPRSSPQCHTASVSARRTGSSLVPLARSASSATRHSRSRRARSCGVPSVESTRSSAEARAAYRAQQAGRTAGGMSCIRAYSVGRVVRTRRRHSSYAASSADRSRPDRVTDRVVVRRMGNPTYLRMGPMGPTRVTAIACDWLRSLSPEHCRNRWNHSNAVHGHAWLRHYQPHCRLPGAGPPVKDAGVSRPGRGPRVPDGAVTDEGRPAPTPVPVPRTPPRAPATAAPPRRAGPEPPGPGRTRGGRATACG